MVKGILLPSELVNIKEINYYHISLFTFKKFVFNKFGIPQYSTIFYNIPQYSTIFHNILQYQQFIGRFFVSYLHNMETGKKYIGFPHNFKFTTEKEYILKHYLTSNMRLNCSNWFFFKLGFSFYWSSAFFEIKKNSKLKFIDGFVIILVNTELLKFS